MTAGITGATRVYLHLAHPSAHARRGAVTTAASGSRENWWSFSGGASWVRLASRDHSDIIELDFVAVAV